MRSKLIALSTGILLASGVAAFAQNSGTVDSTTPNPAGPNGAPPAPTTGAVHHHHRASSAATDTSSSPSSGATGVAKTSTQGTATTGTMPGQ